MKILRNNKPWQTGMFRRGRYELFTGEWVSCYWVPKVDYAGWRNLHAEVQRPEKRASFWEEGLSSLLECDGAAAESERAMT